jgi:hypothetical protein
MEGQRLTTDLHTLLIKKGYKYLLLKEVRVINQLKSAYLLNAVKDMPPIQHDSCTGIQDGMICAIVKGEINHIEIFVEY